MMGQGFRAVARSAVLMSTSSPRRSLAPSGGLDSTTLYRNPKGNVAAPGALALAVKIVRPSSIAAAAILAGAGQPFSRRTSMISRVCWAPLVSIKMSKSAPLAGPPQRQWAGRHVGTASLAPMCALGGLALSSSSSAQKFCR